MKIKLSPSRFYLSNIIFYTCLLAFPLSAAVEQLSQQEGSNPSILDNERLEIYKTEGIGEESSSKLTRDEQIIALINKENERLKEKVAGFENILPIIISMQPKGEYENNALHLACKSSDSIPMVTWLLDECKMGLETKGQYEKTPFLCAAQKGHLQIAKLLRQRGADINAKSETGSNALHFACFYSSSIAMVTWLLDVCHIDIETKGFVQKTPFLCTAEKGNLKIAKLLRQRGASINAKSENGTNALHFACLYSNSAAMVTWLLDVCKIDIESKGQYERTPFLCAAEKGQLAIAKQLKERGANIHAKGYYGRNALHFACLYSSSVDMITWLLDECKIGLEAKGEYKKTPFLCAAQKGHLQIAKLLRQRGADINAKSETGSNALHFACSYSSSIAMVTWLLDVCHIDIETKGFVQKTPFLCAVQNGQVEIAKLLKERGANIHAKNKNGDNALNLAGSENEKMINWLSHVYQLNKATRLNWLELHDATEIFSTLIAVFLVFCLSEIKG